MEYLPKDLSSVVMGILILVSIVAGGILKFKGLLTFGQPVERRDCAKLRCPDHESLANSISTLNIKVASIDEKVDNLNVKIGTLIGYHKGKNGVDL